VIRVERRPYVPTSLVVAGSIIAAATTLIVTAGILGLMHVSPISLVRVVVLATFGSPAAIADTAALAGTLMLTGLAAAFTFRVGLVNLGLEGQLIAGALAALTVSSGALPVTGLAIVPLAIAAGLVVGALSVVLINILKIRLNIDEAIVTIFLNMIMLFALQLVTNATVTGLPPIGALQALPMVNISDFPDWGQMLRYLEPLAAVIVCLLGFVLLRFTIWGLDIRATGDNVFAARFAGINVTLVRLRVAALSGMLIGLAGAGPVVSAGGGSTPNLTLGLGYAGIAVAFLAALEPIGVIPAAIFVAVLLAGMKAANQVMGVSLDLASVTIALLLITALLAHTAVRYQMHRPNPSEIS
jgi:general nucleoside transport system permease protein